MTGPSPTGPLTHGFLFADLRGYTAYAEARGDAAAGDLLDRYRAVVRAVVGDLGGAEIKTEGDSFYVVFPSASRAVVAGLAIVARAADANLTDPTNPINVGVGIHAGEAEERDGGYVGTAVNIAARVCAQARPGEVLVTETVRSLTRTSGRYRFTARGRPTLKGIAEPIALFAATEASADDAAPVAPDHAASRRRLTPLVAGAGLGLVAIAVVAAWLLGGAAGSPASSADPQAARRSAGPSDGPSASIIGTSASPAASGPQPFHTGRLAAGTYVSTVFKPSLEFTVPDGWNGITELPNFLEIDSSADENEQLVFLGPSVGYAPCSSTDFVTLPARREDLVAWLMANKGLSITLAGTLPIGNVEAQELDVGLGDGCANHLGQPLFLIQRQPNGTTGDDRWVVTPGPASPAYFIDAGDRTLVALVGSPASKLDAFTRDVRTVLSSLEVGP